MLGPRSRSLRSFIVVLLLSVIATGLFAGVIGFYSGYNALGGQFSVEQIQYIDGLMFGVEIREEWIDANPDKQITSDEFRIYASQRCAGKFFPDLAVAMKGCLAALQPRPPEGYQFPI